MNPGDKTITQPGLNSLQEREAVLIRQRRTKAGYKPEELSREHAGAALSGGGIRSATFCLGLFQGLATRNLIRRLDYLATVSGGGYFGSFLGRLFTRHWINPEWGKQTTIFMAACRTDQNLLGRILATLGRWFAGAAGAPSAPPLAKLVATRVSPAPAEPPTSTLRSTWAHAATEFVRHLTSPRPVDRVTAVLQDNNSPPLRWLREAGNYLCPAGLSDAAMDWAVFLRNWVALLVVLVTSTLTLFLGGNFLRALLDGWHPFHSYELFLQGLTAEHWWWTPWSPLAALVLIAMVVPLGLAYWLTQAVEKCQFAFVSVANLLVIGMGVLALRLLPEGGFYWPAVVLGLEAALGLFWIWALGLHRCWLGPNPERRLLPELRLGLSVVLVCGLPVVWRCLVGLLLAETQDDDLISPSSSRAWAWAWAAASTIVLVGLHHLALRTALRQHEPNRLWRWLGTWDLRQWKPVLAPGYILVTLALCALPALLTVFAYWFADAKALGFLDVWTVLSVFAGFYLLGYEVLQKDGQPPIGDDSAEAFGLTKWLQSRLSVWLKRGLLAGGVLLLLGITNTLGQSLYATIAYAGGTKSAAAAIAGLLGVSVLAPLARSLAVLRLDASGRWRLPFNLLALAGSGLLAFGLTLSVSFVAHGIAWRWGCPSLEESSRFSGGDLVNLPALADQLQQPTNPVCLFLHDQLGPANLAVLTNRPTTRPARLHQRDTVATNLNFLLQQWGLSNTQSFAAVSMRPHTLELWNQAPQGKDLRTLFRLLLEDAFPREISGNSFLGGFHRISHRIQSDWFSTAPRAAVAAAPSQAPPIPPGAPGAQIYRRFVRSLDVSLTGQNLIQVQPASPAIQSRPKRSRMCVLDLGLSFALGSLLTLLFGQIISFLNLSSFHKLYTARLIRAYLGASNQRRWDEPGASITEVAPRDDIAWGEYHPHASGGPLHLLNVTVNCTVGLATRREAATAKGFNLCRGPAGLSYGSYHALSVERDLGAANDLDATPKEWVHLAQPLAAPAPDPAGPRSLLKSVEPLTLGEWVGISGAAFTTGLGNVGGGGGTSLGTSLLCGLFNVRLGYWWQNEFSPRTDASRALCLPVQTYLLDELTGSFRTENRDRWYLSDGGHFENTAAYELIRRQVPFIVISDAGADPDGNLDDIANLVRRVRLDFGAEIAFWDDSSLLASVDPAFLAPCVVWRSWSAPGQPRTQERDAEPPARMGRIGVLDDLRPTAATPSVPRRVRAQAALAWVTYPNQQKSLLLLIKPGLTPDLPSDLLNYQRAHPEFPQQSTLDQFFDEAQWESHRKLGECIATALFAPAALDSGQWSPSQFCRPPQSTSPAPPGPAWEI